MSQLTPMLYYLSPSALRLPSRRAVTRVRLPHSLSALLHPARACAGTGGSNKDDATDARTKSGAHDRDKTSKSHSRAQRLESVSMRVRDGLIQRYRRACKLSFLRNRPRHSRVGEDDSQPVRDTSKVQQEGLWRHDDDAVSQSGKHAPLMHSAHAYAAGESVSASPNVCCAATDLGGASEESRERHCMSARNADATTKPENQHECVTRLPHKGASTAATSSNDNTNDSDCASKDSSIRESDAKNDATESTSRLCTSSNAFTQSAFLNMPFYEPIKRIILVRNGLSVANENIENYIKQPDWLIPLAEHGKRQCIRAGRELRELVGDEPVYFYYSPYLRSRQSLRWVLGGYDSSTLLPLPPSESETCEKAPNDSISGSTSVTGEDWIDSSTAVMSAINQAASASTLRSSPSTSSASTLSSTGGDASTTNGITNTLDDMPNREDGQLGSDFGLTDDVFSTFVLPIDALLQLHPHTCNSLVSIREDVRLRDGDIGRYKTVDELRYHLTERERYGRFFYRFPHGESGADVCDRVTSFLDALQRERMCFPMNTNVVIITHGLTIRMFVKRWFHLTVNTFDQMRSPPSGSISTLTRMHHQSHFRLEDQCFEAMWLPMSLNETNGYKYRNKQLFGSMSTGAPYM